MDAYREGVFLSKSTAPAGDGTGQGKENAAPEMANPLDPAAMDGMIGMLKKQAVMFIPQSILMGWVNLFFSGFVLSQSSSPRLLSLPSNRTRTTRRLTHFSPSDGTFAR